MSNTPYAQILGKCQVSVENIEVGQTKKQDDQSLELAAARSNSWRRIMLLVFAITLHNIPEGLAVGVAFGGLGTETCKKLDTCSFEDAFNLALGIGMCNAVAFHLVHIALYAPCKFY